jgi:hypothetical protein
VELMPYVRFNYAQSFIASGLTTKPDFRLTPGVAYFADYCELSIWRTTAPRITVSGQHSNRACQDLLREHPPVPGFGAHSQHALSRHLGEAAGVTARPRCMPKIPRKLRICCAGRQPRPHLGPSGAAVKLCEGCLRGPAALGVAPRSAMSSSSSTMVGSTGSVRHPHSELRTLTGRLGQHPSATAEMRLDLETPYQVEFAVAVGVHQGAGVFAGYVGTPSTMERW